MSSSSKSVNNLNVAAWYPLTEKNGTYRLTILVLLRVYRAQCSNNNAGLRTMFSFFKRDPVKKLRQQYDAKAEQAMLAQRKGDMRLFADLTSEAEDLWLQLEKLQAQRNS